MAVPVKHKMYIKIFYKWSSENRFFQPRCRLGGNGAIMGSFYKCLLIKRLCF